MLIDRINSSVLSEPMGSPLVEHQTPFSRTILPERSPERSSTRHLKAPAKRVGPPAPAFPPLLTHNTPQKNARKNPPMVKRAVGLHHGFLPPAVFQRPGNFSPRKLGGPCTPLERRLRQSVYLHVYMVTNTPKTPRDYFGVGFTQKKKHTYTLRGRRKCKKKDERTTSARGTRNLRGTRPRQDHLQPRPSRWRGLSGARGTYIPQARARFLGFAPAPFQPGFHRLGYVPGMLQIRL